MEEQTNEELGRLSYLQEAYTQQYELLTNEISNYTLLQSMLEKNEELLEEAERVKGANMLVSSGSLFFEAKAGSMEKVLISVGAGYVVEETIPEAKKIIEKKLEEINRIIKRLSEERRSVENELMKIGYSISALQSDAHV